MWSYYELTTAQAQADRSNEVGYTVSASAKREYPEDAIGRAFAHQRYTKNDEKQEAGRNMVAILTQAFKAIIRGPAVAR